MVTREIRVNYGYYNEPGEYVENGTFTITHYQYFHNPMDLYRFNENQQGLYLIDYLNGYFESPHYKGIPMRFRFNPNYQNFNENW